MIAGVGCERYELDGAEIGDSVVHVSACVTALPGTFSVDKLEAVAPFDVPGWAEELIDQQMIPLEATVRDAAGRDLYSLSPSCATPPAPSMTRWSRCRAPTELPVTAPEIERVARRRLPARRSCFENNGLRSHRCVSSSLGSCCSSSHARMHESRWSTVNTHLTAMLPDARLDAP